MMDTSDPNDFQQELDIYSARAKALDKERLEKMKGFLLTDKGL